METDTSKPLSPAGAKPGAGVDMPIPGGYRVYLDGRCICWVHPREVAEVLEHFKCVVAVDGFRTIHLV